ncbi:MAG: tetratricopeptide repeat protein [Pseudohongiellaceae bacterium]
MALSASEEETIESLKRWWRESGKALATGIAIIALGWLGWQQWQNRQESTVAEASALYDDVARRLAVGPEETVDEAARDEARDLIGQIRADYADTPYALYAALFSARLAVEEGDLAAAQSDLEWLLDNTRDGWFEQTDPTLVATARLRLGRVLLAREQPAEAMTVISAAEPGALQPEYAELRGDIYRAQGQEEQALEAWRAAAESGEGSPFLDMKINELATGASE